MIQTQTPRFRFTLVYLFAALATLGIAPFIVMRYVQGEVLHALLDGAIVAVALINAFIAYKFKRVTTLNLTIAAVLYTSGAVVVAYLNNALFVFWVFPATFANVFLLSSRYSLLLNVIATLSIAPLAMALENHADGMAMMASLAFSICLAHVFSLQNERQHRQLAQSAAQDPLTQLANRRALTSSAEQCLEDFLRNRIPTTLIMFDLDFFKQVNDQFGHSVGDELLQQVARLLEKRIRKTDRAFRFGGEEFVILARNTGITEAAQFADLLRTHIMLEIIAPEGELTASFGCAELHDKDTLDSWFERADRAVYSAKDSGRNCVICAD